MGATLGTELRSWHLSVLFRTSQLFQELLFKLVLLKFPTNFQFPKKIQFISKKFQNYFKPNHKSPKTVEKLQPKLCKNVSPLKVKIYKPLKKNFFFSNFFLATLQDICKLQIIKIFGDHQKFLKDQKSKGGILRSEYFSKISKLLTSQSVFIFLPIFMLFLFI